MLLVAVPIGLLIGLALGALGGGGSILTVPALVYLLDQTPRDATTGSLLIVGITSLAGMAAHWKTGGVRVGQGVVFGVLGLAGSYAGARLSGTVRPQVLLAGFAALMLVAAGAMLRRALAGCRHSAPVAPSAAPRRTPTVRGRVSQRPLPAWPTGTAVLERPAVASEPCRLPRMSWRFTTCRAVKVVVAATVVGLLTGFFGVGGGFVIVPALVLALGFEMPVAVGTSLLVIAINSTAALAVRLGSGTHLDWPVLTGFTVSAIAGSVIGNRVASRVDARKLTVAFAVLLVAVGAYTAARAVPQLL